MTFTPERIAQLREILRTNPNNDILYAGAVFAALDEIERLSVKIRELADNDGCCEGCGSTMSIADLRKMGAVACCPKRKMVSAKEWREKAIASEATLSRVTAERDEAVGLLSELSDLVEDTLDGAYKPDSFTTQPARAFLSRMEGRKDG